MFKRLILISALVISAVAMSSTHANAQFFDGWGWFGFSSVRGDDRSQQSPNPTEQALSGNSYGQQCCNSGSMQEPG